MQVTSLTGFHPFRSVACHHLSENYLKRQNPRRHDLALPACVPHVLNPKCYPSPNPPNSPLLTFHHASVTGHGFRLLQPLNESMENDATHAVWI